MEILINKLDHFGRGIGTINNKIVFVNRSLPEEIVDIKIIKEKKNFMEANINKIINPSKDRINALCPNYDKCGGCNLLHTTYDVEKNFKINKAKELLGRCDNFYETSNMNYRNKVTLHVKNNKIGLFNEKSNEIIDLDYCYLLDDKINKVIKRLSIYLKNNKTNINSIVIKLGNDKLLLNVNGEINNNFINEFNDIDIILNNNKVLKGNNELTIKLSNYTLLLGGNAFFQVNNEGLNNIHKIVDNYLINKHYHKVLDLYSGVSTWGIVASKYSDKVISIECNLDATNYAKANIKLNNINNLEVINGKVEDNLDKFFDTDLLIIDPPRSGMDKKTIEYLKNIKAREIIYISCDMQTLKRDINELNDLYKLVSVDLVDMFKRTYHCESLVVLERIDE